MYFSGISRRLKQTWVLGLLAFALAAPEWAQADVTWLSANRTWYQKQDVFLTGYGGYYPPDIQPGITERTVTSTDFGSFQTTFLYRSTIGPNTIVADCVAEYDPTAHVGILLCYSDQQSGSLDVAFRLSEPTAYTLQLDTDFYMYGWGGFPPPEMMAGGDNPYFRFSLTGVGTANGDFQSAGILPAGDYQLSVWASVGDQTPSGYIRSAFDLNFTLDVPESRVMYVVPEPASLSGLALAGSALLLRRRSR